MRLTLAAALVAFTPALALAAGDDDHDHLSEIDGLRVLHAWAPATDEDHVRVYVEIENTDDHEISLIGGEAEIGDEVHLMATDFTGTNAEGVEIEALPIAPGSEAELGPDGVFLLIHGVTEHLHKGDEFEMHLIFDPAGEVEIHVEVEESDATQHSHAGHSH